MIIAFLFHCRPYHEFHFSYDNHDDDDDDGDDGDDGDDDGRRGAKLAVAATPDSDTDTELTTEDMAVPAAIPRPRSRKLLAVIERTAMLVHEQGGQMEIWVGSAVCQGILLVDYSRCSSSAYSLLLLHL